MLHVLHQYPPEFRGGTEACVESLARAQRGLGHEVTVLCGTDARRGPGTGGDVVRETVEGVPVVRIVREEGENYGVDFRCARVAAQVLALAEEAAPDVVHWHHGLNLSGDLVQRLAGAGHRVVATLHDFTLVCARFFLVRPDGESCEDAFPLPAERCVACVLPDFPAGEAALRVELAARGATARAEAAATARAIVPSRFVRERWLRSGLFDEATLVTLPHPTPLAAAPPRAPRRRDDGRLVLATWGHLAPAKGVLDLLAALARLESDAATRGRCRLEVLGAPTDPAHEAALREAAAGLDVRLSGAYRAEDLHALAGRADLAVFPSRAHETFSLVAAEARALGLPVLASDRGALPEAVGEAGETLPAADPHAWAARLAALVADPGPLARWAAAAPRDLPTPARHAEAVVELYALAVHPPAPPGR